MQWKTAFLSLILTVSFHSLANNSVYINLSNTISRTEELGVVANNAANTNTYGYEADRIVFNNFDVMQTKRKTNSFVISKGMYKSENPGGIKTTNNPLDLAIIGENQYFKVLTPRGPRYTLAGNIIRNAQNILVTSDGYPFLSNANGILELPADAKEVSFASNGTIYADGDEIDRIGVFSIPTKYGLIKEGSSLYYSKSGDIPLDEYTVMSGALRASNVNASKVMGEMIELQRSVSASAGLMHEIHDLEKDAVSKILKQ